MSCLICQADQEQQNQIWYAYADRLRSKDAFHSAQSVISPDLTSAQVSEHLRQHHFIQPSPPGQGLNRSLALQEALTSFPRYWFYILLAIYKAQALSGQQLYDLFYLDHAQDSKVLRQQLEDDLHRLSCRSFLYRVWPETLAHTLTFEDHGPYYFLGRQAIPLIERLQGMEPESLAFGAYVTSAQQVQEFYLERDSRFMKAIVAIRSNLYRRQFSFDGQLASVHLSIENWYAPVQLHCQLEDGQPFAPSALLAFRFQSNQRAFSYLLPCWFEYDRGTEEADEVAGEALRYGSYYNSLEYQNKFKEMARHSCPGPLIIICDDTYRREEVRLALAQRLKGKEVPIYLTDRQSLISDPYNQEILMRHDGQRSGLMETIWEDCVALREAHATPGTGSLTEGTSLISSTPDSSAEADLSGWSAS